MIQNYLIFKKSLVAIFILVILTVVAFFVYIDWPLARYVLSEWLISYDGGFVRRGLPGFVINIIKESFNIESSLIVSIIAWSNYLIYLIISFIYLFFLIRSWRFLSIENLFVFLFAPCLIIFPLQDINGLGRKDYFFFFPMILNLFIMKSSFSTFQLYRNHKISPNTKSEFKTGSYLKNMFWAYNMISIPIALTHEAIIFFSVPINIIITYSILVAQDNTSYNSLVKSVAITIPTIIVSFICMYFKGDYNTYKGLIGVFEGYKLYFPEPEKAGAIYYLMYTTKDAFLENIKLNIFDVTEYRLILWLFCFFVFFSIILKNAYNIVLQKLAASEKYKMPMNLENRSLVLIVFFRIVFKYFIIPTIFIIPLYVIAFDYGRWFMIPCVTFVFCILSNQILQIELNIFLKRFKEGKGIPFQYFVNKIHLFFNTIVFPSRTIKIGYYIIMFYSVLFIRFPHYKINVIDLVGGYVPVCWRLASSIIN